MIRAIDRVGRWPERAASTSVMLIVVACSGSPTTPVGDAGNGPAGEGPADTATALPPTDLDRSDITPSGDVVETEDGYLVDGSLTMEFGDGESVTFTDAEVRLRFDEEDRLTSFSGRVEIPSPHERIEFEDPVRAEVGLFSGAFLNEERDLGILLKEDTDYFLFDFGVALQMNVATGETGEDAVKPITIKEPVGGRALMVIDYRDPMYYVYGQQDLIGAAGIGWSQNGRIPFVPKHEVADLGAFDGRTTRTGTFPIFKVFSVTGQTVDNEYTEVHLSLEDPFASDLRKGYQQGWNGDFELDLGIKDVVGLTIPVGDGTGGVWAEAGMQDVFQGHAYAVGATTEDFSWWPTFLPVSPAHELDVSAYVTHTAEFEVALAGRYGWNLPDGVHTMGGGFELRNDGMTLGGEIVDGEVVWALSGRVTSDATTVTVDPPPELLDAIHTAVNGEVLPRIEEAQQAWQDLKEATADYEFELSLRGLRTQLPAIVDVAKSAILSGIASELRKHEGTIYYDELRRHVYAAVDPYIDALDNLKAQALEVRDNAQTRAAIESALRTLAANKIFRTTFRYYDPVLGILLAEVPIRRRILTDAQADALITAADNVKYIQETSNLKITMQQIYDQVDDRALFERVRDDLRDGLLVMRQIDELGFVHPHAEGKRAFDVFVVIDGRRYEPGALQAMTVDAYAGLLSRAMIEALKVD